MLIIFQYRWILVALFIFCLQGCQAYHRTEVGIINKYSNCKGKPQASDDANQVIRLKSSFDETYFYVDGKKINSDPAKLFEICINNELSHKVKAQPKDCPDDVSIIENYNPPYNNPFYEFIFMAGQLNECRINQTANEKDNKSNVFINIGTVKKKKNRKKGVSH